MNLLMRLLFLVTFVLAVRCALDPNLPLSLAVRNDVGNAFTLEGTLICDVPVQVRFAVVSGAVSATQNFQLPPNWAGSCSFTGNITIQRTSNTSDVWLINTLKISSSSNLLLILPYDPTVIPTTF